MIKLSVDSEVFAELVTRLTSLPDMVRTAARKSARRQAKAILKDAVDNYVPEDEGDLAKSGQVEDKSSGNEVRVEISFGKRGPSAAYAVAVHEHLSQHSPPSWQKAESGGQGRDKRGRFLRHGVHFRRGGPKYLEQPMTIATDGGKYENQIVDEVKTVLPLPESWKQYADVMAEDL